MWNTFSARPRNLLFTSTNLGYFWFFKFDLRHVYIWFAILYLRTSVISNSSLPYFTCYGIVRYIVFCTPEEGKQPWQSKGLWRNLRFRMSLCLVSSILGSNYVHMLMSGWAFRKKDERMFPYYRTVGFGAGKNDFVAGRRWQTWSIDFRSFARK